MSRKFAFVVLLGGSAFLAGCSSISESAISTADSVAPNSYAKADISKMPPVPASPRKPTSPSATQSKPVSSNHTSQKPQEISDLRFSKAAQAALKTAYRVKNDDPSGEYALTSADDKHLEKLLLGPRGKISFFRKVGPLEVTFFVASNEEEVIVAFRGSETEANWMINGVPFAMSKNPFEELDKAVAEGKVTQSKDEKVEEGIQKFGWGLGQIEYAKYAMPVVRDEYPGLLVQNGWQLAVASIINRLKEELRAHEAGGKSITITGHSLGGALAGYSAFRLVSETNFFAPNKPHLLATFAAPHYALKTSNGAPLVFLCNLAVNSATVFGSINQELGQIREVLLAPFKASSPEQFVVKSKQFPGELVGAVNKATSSFQKVTRHFEIPKQPELRADYKKTFEQLLQRKAPLMKVYAVEASGFNNNGNSRSFDGVTVAWDIGGITEYGIQSLREMHKQWKESATVDIPVLETPSFTIPGILGIAPDVVVPGVKLVDLGRQCFMPPGTDELMVGVIRDLTPTAQAGFGVAERVGELIDIQTDLNVNNDNLHHQDSVYFDGLVKMKLAQP